MKVSLVSITQPLIHNRQGSSYIMKTAEELIVFCARVSSPQNQTNMDTAPKLLRYLLEHKHWSPFEMASMCLEIETSRAIAAQILRHRSFSFQEFSQRYADASQLGFELVHPRRQASKNRQSSIDDLTDEDFNWFHECLSDIEDSASYCYREAIGRGIAKESARFLLPLSTATRLYMNGTVRSWIHYFQARQAEETQLEHREIANAARKIFDELFPVIGGLI